MTDTTKLADELERLRTTVGKEAAFACMIDNYDAILAALRAAPAVPADKVHVLFDRPPGHETGRFIECENPEGKSINAGEWHERPDGLWELVISLASPAVQGEPVAWCDPLDIAEAQESFMACSNSYRRRTDSLRYKTPLYAAINGPAACSQPAMTTAGGIVGAGSGVAPIEGLADAIAWALEHVPIMDSPGAPDWAGRHVHALITAARAYQEVAAELARVKGERDALLAALTELHRLVEATDDIVETSDRYGIYHNDMMDALDAASAAIKSLTPTTKEQT